MKIIFKITFIFCFVVLFNFSIASAYSKEVTVNLNDDNTSKVTTLEELINDEKEQEFIKKLYEQAKNQEQNEKENQYKVQTYNASASSAVDYTDMQYNSSDSQGYSLVERVIIPGLASKYDYNIYASYDNSCIKVNKHDIETQVNTEIARVTDTVKLKYLTYHVRDNILYILYIKGYNSSLPTSTEYDTGWVIGIDLREEKSVYEKFFDSPQVNNGFSSFAVDGNQNFYFVYGNTGTKIFDKSGNLIFNKDPMASSDFKNYFKCISPNNKVLFFQVMYGNSPSVAQSVYEGMQALENGVFKYSGGYTCFGRSYPNNYSYQPRWYFFDESDSTYAIDQYGRIGKFEYDLDPDITYKMEASREIILDLHSKQVDMLYSLAKYPIATKFKDYLYIVGANNNVYKVNSRTFEIEGYIDIGASQSTTSYPFYRMRFIDDKMYINMSKSYTLVERMIDLSKVTFNSFGEIIYSEQSSNKHTIKDIVQKYLETKPIFDYTKSMYEAEPVWVSPYVAGSLKPGVIADALNKLNYYRWLVAVDEVTLNEERMIKNQKGAVLLQRLNQLTHTPEQPSDMEDDFYKDAFEGVYAGVNYSGNVSYNDSNMTKSVMGWIDDIYNVTTFSTGHRQSLLDPKAIKTSFGMAGRYSAMSMYTDSSKDISSEDFYAYPSAGNFPNSEMKTDQLWSFYHTDTNISGTISVKFTYNQKTYQGYISGESGYPVVNFQFPEELIDKLGGAGKTIPAGTTIKVEVVGYKDANLNDIKFEYTVNFFDLNMEIAKEELGDIKITTIPYENIESKNVMTFDTKTPIDKIKTDTNFPVLLASYKVKVYSKDGVTEKKETDKIGSKNAIRVINSSENVVAEFSVIVKGDVTGNGEARMYDAFQILKDTIIPGVELDGIDIRIRDYNKDGNVRMYDAFQFLKDSILG